MTGQFERVVLGQPQCEFTDGGYVGDGIVDVGFRVNSKGIELPKFICNHLFIKYNL